jgi:hypothetical protein
MFVIEIGFAGNGNVFFPSTINGSGPLAVGVRQQPE